MNEKIKNITKYFKSTVKQESTWRAFVIIIKYVMMGSLWILLSDKILNYLVSSEKIRNQIQLYKGWLYVAITGLVFYIIINNALKKHTELQENIILEKEISGRIINDASSIIVVFNLERVITHFNPYAERITGYKKSEIIGKVPGPDCFCEGSLDKLFDTFELVLDNNYKEYSVETELKVRDGSLKNILWNLNVLKDKNKRPTGLIAVGSDITNRTEMELQLKHIAYYDELTELPNRKYLEKMAKESFDKDKKFVIANIDIDEFKNINDILGHDTGDYFIKQMAEKITSFIHSGDIVARISGDQFALIIYYRTKELLEDWLKDFIEYIRQPWEYNNREFFITVSIGVAFSEENKGSFENLMKNSDIALFYKKDHGKDGYALFDQLMYEDTLKNINIASQLKEAVKNNDFILYYQPQVDLKSKKTVGVEALIRWKHKERGFISPAEFIPYAEKTEMILPITEFVLKESLRVKKYLDEMGYNIKMSVNFSGYIMAEEKPFELIKSYIETMDIKKGEFEAEVTETALMLELGRAKDNIEDLQKMGFSIAMDDFGTGYSSLNYLQMLPLDCLKIDKSFIKEEMEKKEEIIYKTVIELAHSMGFSVIAEGIETEKQLEFVVNSGCDIVQGYYFSRPLPLEELIEFLQK